MADLIPSQARKAADAAPRNENERRILAARAGHAALAAAFASKPTQKGAQPSAPAPSAFLSSGFGGPSNMELAQPSKATKADASDLPASVARIAHKVSGDSAKLLGAIVRRHEASGQPIEFTSMDAAKLLGCTEQRARAVRDSLVAGGFLVIRANVLGGPAGYTPALPA